MRLGREQSRGVVDAGAPRTITQAEDLGEIESQSESDRHSRRVDAEPTRIAAPPPRPIEEEVLLPTR